MTTAVLRFVSLVDTRDDFRSFLLDSPQRNEGWLRDVFHQVLHALSDISDSLTLSCLQRPWQDCAIVVKQLLEKLPSAPLLLISLLGFTFGRFIRTKSAPTRAAQRPVLCTWSLVKYYAGPR